MTAIDVLKMIKNKINIAAEKYNAIYVIETSDVEAINKALEEGEVLQNDLG